MRELLFTVTVDGRLVAGFAHISDAESFAAAIQFGSVQVLSRGDGYCYGTWQDGRELDPTPNTARSE